MTAAATKTGPATKHELQDILKTTDDYSLLVCVKEAAHRLTALALRRHERWIGVPVIVSSTIVGTAIFATLQDDDLVGWRIATGLLSVVAAVLAAMQTFFNFGRDAHHHESAAFGFAKLSREFDVFLLQLAEMTETRAEYMTHLQLLTRELNKLEHGEPHIPQKTWIAARKRVKTEVGRRTAD